MKFNPRAALRRLVVAMAAGLLGAAATALALLALYMYATAMLNPMFGALVTAGGALVLAALLLLVGRCCRTLQRRSRRVNLRQSANPEEIGKLLQQLLRRNPKRATMIALALGAALGVSPELRRSIVRLLRKS